MYLDFKNNNTTTFNTDSIILHVVDKNKEGKTISLIAFDFLFVCFKYAYNFYHLVQYKM